MTNNKNKTVLLIDDDMDIIEVNKAILEKDGYKVIFALDGEGGFEKAKTALPDMIVLDVMMDTIDEGFMVARQLRNLETTKHIPLIMLTAINEKSGFPWKYEKDETWLPVDVFLEKPVKPNDLLNNVRRLV